VSSQDPAACVVAELIRPVDRQDWIDQAPRKDEGECPPRRYIDLHRCASYPPGAALC
jgi:hypothetical protein